MKKYILIAFVFFPSVLQSQIINVESVRRATDTIGWSGYTSLILELVKNKNTIFGISNRTRIQYKGNKHLWLFLNDFDFRKTNDENFVNRNAQHVRYNYRFEKKLSFEAFLQSQTDEISAIRFRGLLGCGIRFKVSKKEKYKLYLGTLIMYEHENIVSTTEPNNRDWRKSTYFSMSLYPKSNISIVSTTYFQPRFDRVSDFRISSQNTIAFEIVKKLMFTANFTYQYDEFPVIGVPKEQYRFTNGLLYSF
ncbi:DUF481 domain-containing protein [Tenacibaculum sp. SZ-18]|uniref:DUF481 domain-containing protein n=1 Tax=Tenacibaculum sp. SZ-18 TaxID=754423 RepID=UPI0012FE6430|nr:DUF481 domain-containing protein [Tenacibaculum sp. SZ-18]